MRPCRATRAGTQAPPLPISIIFFHAIPHKQNNHLHTIHPNDINHPRAIYPNETVGAVPVCPPKRPRSGVSIPKYIYASRIMHEDLTMDAPLQGDTGGHTGTAPTNPHQTPLPRNLHRFCPSAEPLPAIISCFSPPAEPLPPTFAHETRKVAPFMKGLQLFFVILQPIVSITRKR